MVSGSLSETKEGEQDSSPSFTYTEKFYEQFPYYLSIGMTPEQYWDGDPALVKYFRQAEEMRVERRNYEMWLQGLYVYEAICDVSPILHAFAKKGTKPQPYSDQPYAVTASQRKRAEEEREREIAERGKRRIMAMMSSGNAPSK